MHILEYVLSKMFILCIELYAYYAARVVEPGCRRGSLPPHRAEPGSRRGALRRAEVRFTVAAASGQPEVQESTEAKKSK